MSTQALEQQLCPTGTTLYYALGGLQPPERQVFIGLFTIHNEMKKLVFAQSDATILKLGWWRHEIDSLLSGSPGHPATIALAGWNDVAMAGLTSWIDSLQPLLGTSRFEDEQTLVEFCVTLTEPLFRACDARLGNDHTDQEIIRNSAVAYLLFGMIQDLGGYLRAGIVPVPVSDLDRLEIAADGLLEPEPSALERLVHAQCGRIAGLLDSLPDQRHAEPQNDCRHIRVINAIHMATLKQIRLSCRDVVNNRIDLTPLRKAWIAWNIMRKY